MIYKSFNIAAPKFPLESYANKNVFKIYSLDVGLLGSMSHLPIKAVLESHQLFTEFKGALTENFVATELLTRHENALYYWTSQGEAEVDFILPIELDIYPLEVKAGISGRKKSLLHYNAAYSHALDHSFAFYPITYSHNTRSVIRIAPDHLFA